MLTTITVPTWNNTASCRELSKLTTDMNTIPSSSRPSRNSQGIHSMSQHPMGYTASQSDQQGTPVNALLPRSVLTNNGADQDYTLADIPSSKRQVESFTLCVRQNDRFVDLSGKPLQPGTIIICDKIPFVVSNNGKIYNFSGGSFEQLYVADPSEHEVIVSLAKSHGTFSSILNSLRNSISLEQNQFFLGTQAFASPTDMASSGIWENVHLSKTTHLGWCVWNIILYYNFEYLPNIFVCFVDRW